jgi:hypothetical protein
MLQFLGLFGKNIIFSCLHNLFVCAKLCKFELSTLNSKKKLLVKSKYYEAIY